MNRKRKLIQFQVGLPIAIGQQVLNLFNTFTGPNADKRVGMEPAETMPRVTKVPESGEVEGVH